jgi:sensor histidine kinase regulating citrate/malate metabolism
MILKRASLRDKLLFIIMAVSTFCVLITTIAITVFGIVNIREKMLSDIEVNTKLTADRLNAAISFLDLDKDKKDREGDIYWERVKTTLDYLTSVSGVKAVCIYKFDGDINLAASLFDEGAKTKCPSEDAVMEKMDKTFSSSSGLHRYQRIESKGQINGFLYIRSSWDEIDQYIRDQVLTAAIIILLVFAISYILAKSLQRSISAPILHLVETTRKVAREKDYSIRAKNFLQGDDMLHFIVPFFGICRLRHGDAAGADLAGCDILRRVGVGAAAGECKQEQREQEKTLQHG